MYGWNSTWFTEGGIRALSRRYSRSEDPVFDSPIPRTRPSSTSFSISSQRRLRAPSGSLLSGA